MRIFIFTLIILLFSCNDTPTSNSSKPTSKTTMTENKKIDWQGHRGARGLLPENTIPAFIKALEYPVSTLELDICIAKDTTVIVTHEPWFNHKISAHPDGTPVTEEEEKDLLIYNMTYEEVKKYDVGSRGNERFPDQQPMKVSKPSLKDMVKAVDAHCKETGKTLPNYDIEIKSHPDYYNVKTPPPAEYVRLILAELKELGIENRCNLQSFDINVLEEIHKQDPSVIVAYLIESTDSPNKNLEKITFKPDIYSPYFLLLSKEIIDDLHAQDIKVIPWTVNEVVDMKRMITFGVDGIITDYPNRIASALVTSKE